ncbi:class I SAM-dependent methyltransferase [Pedobacter alpinus]|uniref:Class I SAM-dependent methyltransferase n=1 Tax=Pedobacter alpinus TaxID=1590643 RepID=A0ABW5TXJ6_9SPHI
MQKSTLQEIQERFDNDVERFSNLNTGQVSTIDAEISLELITEAAKSINPKAKSVLDIGCGAGNYTLKMLTKLPNLNCTLVDLSEPMLTRAKERVSVETEGEIEVRQGDIRAINFGDKKFDIILAGAVLHHLRDEKDWEETFKKLYNLLNDGGSLWISDLVVEDSELITKLIWDKYGDYLEGIGGKDFRENVFAYIEKEDSPRSLNFQLALMKKVGFSSTEILHKNLCFAAFGGLK